MQRKTTIILFATVVFAGSSTLLYAAGHGGELLDRRPSFDELDKNADKMISKEEISAHARGRFQAGDTNNDGLLSSDELTAMHLAHVVRVAQARQAKMLAKLDTDQDGSLSFEEIQACRKGPNPKRLFEHFDADKNGMISQDEFTLAQDRGQKGKRKDRR